MLPRRDLGNPKKVGMPAGGWSSSGRGQKATGRAATVILAAGTMLIGLGQGSFAVNAITLRQLASSDEMRARATSVHRFVSWGALPVGSVLAGLIGQHWGIRTAMITAGLISATCAWPLLASPLRHRDPGV